MTGGGASNDPARCPMPTAASALARTISGRAADARAADARAADAADAADAVDAVEATDAQTKALDAKAARCPVVVAEAVVSSAAGSAVQTQQRQPAT